MRQIAFMALMILANACSTEQGKQDHSDHTAAQTEATKYTCPMHPNVIQDKPGKCPVCGMDLVPVSKSTQSDNTLMLSESQIRLANIVTQKVATRPVGQTVLVNGTLKTDQDRTETISSRASGRIERLHVKEVGRAVTKGEILYELYSEQLLTLQREYLLAKEQAETLGVNEPHYGSFLKAADRKLILYGLTRSQIEKLAESKHLEERIAFVSPASGIVSEISVAEGQYVNEGALLYRIEDTGRLWVEAELYPSETGLVSKGSAMQVTVAGYENLPVAAKVEFLNPEYKNNTQITLVRASIANSGRMFQSGMQAQIAFMHNSRSGLVIPVDAIIRDANGTHVYVQTDVNTFQPRMVTTGTENFEQVEILGGLTENETIAVSGAYLIYSELILKNGKDPMAGHSHN